jgi:hypothetical protein
MEVEPLPCGSVWSKARTHERLRLLEAQIGKRSVALNLTAFESETGHPLKGRCYPPTLATRIVRVWNRNIF